MRLGARILKTGISVSAAILICSLLGLGSPTLAGISAIAVQQTVYRSYITILQQFQSNLIGAAFAIGFSLAFGNSPLVIGLTVIVVLIVALQLKLENTVTTALVTIVAIMESTGENFFHYSLDRIATVLVGITIASLINFLFLPPKYETRLYVKLSTTTEEILKWIRISITQTSEPSSLRAEIETFRDSLFRIDTLFSLYKEEREHFKKHELSKTRKLVLFRQMITTTRAAFITLKNLNRLEYELQQMPEEVVKLIKNELNMLVNFHEQVLLELFGKVKPQALRVISNEESEFKQRLIHTFLKYRNEENKEQDKSWLHVFQIISAIIDYSEQVEHLDRLIQTTQTYHNDETNFEIEEEEKI
ncbi:MAG: aromatic acid exporter family protein [Bacillaceae bacterium]